jgi:hypothetical protein
MNGWAPVMMQDAARTASIASGSFQLPPMRATEAMQLAPGEAGLRPWYPDLAREVVDFGAKGVQNLHFRRKRA